MRKSKIVGRKVKVMPNNNQGVVVSIVIWCRNKTLVRVADNKGGIMLCYLHELRYLNNREVRV